LPEEHTKAFHSYIASGGLDSSGITLGLEGIEWEDTQLDFAASEYWAEV